MLTNVYAEGLCNTALRYLYRADFALRMGMADAKPNTNPKDNMDATAVIYYQMKELVKKMKAFQSTDMMMKAHYDYLVRYIEKTLDKE